MRNAIGPLCGFALLLATPALAQDGIPPGGPVAVLREIVTGMPKGERQEVRVLTAILKPGDRTPLHTHRFPVTVYVLEGAFTLEIEGRPPLDVKSGEAMIEPTGVRMTGFNRASEATKVLIVYVSDPGAPFLDAHQH